MEQHRVLIVDDDEIFRTLLSDELRQRGYRVFTASGVEQAKEVIGTEEVEVAVVDLRLGDGDGLDVVTALRERQPRAEPIVLTGHGSIDTAIAAMRQGAFDYLRKPCPTRELEVALGRALEHQALVEKATILRDGLAPSDPGPRFVGSSKHHQELLRIIERVARTDSTVLVLGETGVGKDVVASMIHARSARRGQPFVVVECAALQSDLLHNELFGHERGAFTGASQVKHGLFEVAHGGTLFLDEIGDVSLQTQVKLLRVLEAGTFRRVGGTRQISVDVRIVAATNRDLPRLMDEGAFRRDLYFRLNTIHLVVPPLRDRPEDIPVLAEYFMGRLNARFGLKRRLPPEATAQLQRHRWPGNARELLHALEQAVILSEGDLVNPRHLPGGDLSSGAAAPEPLLPLAEVERRHIAKVLEAVNHNRKEAAAILGISERTLYRKLPR